MNPLEFLNLSLSQFQRTQDLATGARLNPAVSILYPYDKNMATELALWTGRTYRDVQGVFSLPGEMASTATSTVSAWANTGAQVGQGIADIGKFGVLAIAAAVVLHEAK